MKIDFNQEDFVDPEEPFSIYQDTRFIDVLDLISQPPGIRLLEGERLMDDRGRGAR